jgi:hypothetical protein
VLVTSGPRHGHADVSVGDADLAKFRKCHFSGALIAKKCRDELWLLDNRSTLHARQCFE